MRWIVSTIVSDTTNIAPEDTGRFWLWHILEVNIVVFVPLAAPKITTLP